MDGSELYYSPQAVERFQRVEEVTRRQMFHYAYNEGFLTSADFHTITTTPAGNSVLQSPLFGAWLDRILQAEQTSGLPENEARLLATQRGKYVGNYAILTALRSGLTLETEAWAHEGFVMIPELGRLATPGLDNESTRVTLDDSLTITATDKKTRLSLDALVEESPLWQPLRRIGPSGFSIALNDIDPNRLDIYRYPVSPRLTQTEYQLWADTFAEAWDFLQQHDTHLASLVRAHLNTIIPAPTEPLTHSKTMAAGATIGAISFNENRDPLRLLSQIAFGLRKDMALALRTATPRIYPDEHMHDPVYPPSREGYGIAAHLQDDSFVNVGLARFYHNLLKQGDSALRDYYELSFARWYTESKQNMDAWKRSAYVQTGNGWLYNSLGWELSALRETYNALPDAPKQAAATNSLDRYVSWRLHTVMPDPQAVIYLRNYWGQHTSCPPIEIPSVLSQSNEAYVNLGQRTRYVLAEVQLKEPDLFTGVQKGQYDPSLFGNLTLGDVAFAGGNYRETREYFTHAVRQRPDNIEAWAGLALTFEHERSPAAEALKRQPELVAALYVAIGNRSLEPAAVADWLMPCEVAQVCPGA